MSKNRHTFMTYQLFFILFMCTLSGQEEKVIPKTLSAIGTIIPQNTSSMSSAVSGRILDVLVDVGTRVKKGDILLQIDPLFFEIDVALAEAELTSAQVQLADAELNFQRMSKLWNKPEGVTPSISKKQYENAEVRLEQEKAHVQEALENLKKTKARLEETRIRAPYDGIITKRLTHPGESVTGESATPLLEIESFDNVYIEFPIPQTALREIHVGTPITFEIDGLTLENQNAAITLIYPHVDEKTRSVKCRASLTGIKQPLSSGA